MGLVVVIVSVAVLAVLAVLFVSVVRARRRATERDEAFIDVSDRLVGTGADPAVISRVAASRPFAAVGNDTIGGRPGGWDPPAASRPTSDTVVFAPTATRARPTITLDPSRQSGEAVIELGDDGEAVIVLGGSAGDPTVDRIASELAREVGLTDEDLAEVAAELAQTKGGLAEAAALLDELIAADPKPDPTEGSELTLFSEEAPRRPGRFTDLNALSPVERRRVIIRVLCLLVARSDDDVAAAADAARAAAWEGPPPGESPRELPTRHPGQSTADVPSSRL
jgi:hypothetical protein